VIIHSVIASNFGSYEYVSFDPENKGLSLIYGPTGSGKSTIPDIISWVLFGVTAKNGNIDDVRNWTNLEEPTSAEVVVTTKEGSIITVSRTRGGTNKNDLVWYEGGRDTPNRGKDLNDTQLLLLGKLGMDSEVYCGSSYYTEVGKPARFFLSNSKERREVLEQITDLSLPVAIAESASEAKKLCKQEIKTLDTQLSRISGGVDQVKLSKNKLQQQAAQWEEDRKSAISVERIKSDKFEELKASQLAALQTKSDAFELSKLSEISKVVEKINKLTLKHTLAKAAHIQCASCGTVKGAEEVAKLAGEINLAQSRLETIQNTANPHLPKIEKIASESNQASTKIRDLEQQTNPHTQYLEDLTSRLRKHEKELDSKAAELRASKERLASLDQLYKVSFLVRGKLLSDAVKTVENSTNRNLETYFDSEFRVAFNADDGDNLDVQIFKNGYLCSYRQLSKGQRQLLKLCFCVSIMEATSITSGIHHGSLFFDEALDGLDDSMKVKAFSLFEHLARNHGSVFVIEHSQAFQELFENKYKVTIKEDKSSIEAET